MHIVVIPILLGRGVRLWDGLEDLERNHEIEMISSPAGVQARLRRPARRVHRRASGNRLRRHSDPAKGDMLVERLTDVKL